MNPFKGYVLLVDLADKAKVNDSLFRQTPKIIFKMMGGLTCMLIESLPEKYKRIAKEECLDLENYWSFAYLSKELGTSKDYITQMVKTKPIKTVTIGGTRLVVLPKEFKSNLEIGLVPIKIKNKEDRQHVKRCIDMYNMSVGFY